MKHQLTRKRIVSILLAVCMIVSMLPLAGALDVSEGSAYAEVNGGNAYYRYFIPGQYTRQWYSHADVPGQDAKTYHWSVYQNIWNGTIGHSTNRASALNGVSGGVSTHYGTDQMTDAFYLHRTDLNGNVISFGKYYGAVAPSIRMTIRVPSSDTYTVKANFYYGLAAQDDAVDFWIAPDDAEDPMAEDYYFAQLSGIVTGQTANAAKFGEVGTIDLEAGEYIVTMKGANGKTLYGGNLELYGSMAPTIVDLTVDDTALNEDGYLEVPAGDEDGCWITIFAEDRDFGELDLIEWDAPSYARVDEYSDMIEAYYEDGMVNVKASYVGEKDTTTATLYLEVGGAATWVEIPVKVVQGAESILTLSHTGATDKIMAKVGEYPITLKANVDGTDTAITEEDIVDVEIVDADGNVTDAVTATVDGATVLFAATAGGSYTAKVTATVAGVELKNAYEIPLTVTNFGLYYDFMKMGPSSKIVPSSSGFIMKDFIDSYADTWTGGSTDVNTDITSDGWKIGAKGEGSGEWLWTSSAQALGAYVAPAGSWNSMDLYVPVSGNYTITSIHSVWTAGGDVDYYLAPVGTENPIADEYKLATVSHKDTTNYAVEVPVGTVDLEAGEYMLVFKSANGIFQKGIKLDLNGMATGSKVWIDDSTIFAEYSDISRTYWTWNPKALPAFLASGVKFTFSSSNENVLKVNADHSITIKHEGYADVVITGSDGSVCRVPAVAGLPDASYKFRTGAISAYTAKGGNAYLMDTDFYNKGYTHAENNGYGAWFVSGGSSFDVNHPAYFFCNWGSTATNGLLATYGNQITDHAQVQIRVDEDGEYLIKTLVDKNSIAWAPHNIYLAPVGAENPTADEYLIGEVTGTRAASGKAFTPFVMDPVEITAGEYTITFQKVNVNGSTVYTQQNGYDYITINDFSFYNLSKTPAVALDTVDGAQIRTTGKQGLRFISSFAKSGDWALIKEVGTVLIPTADLTADTDLVIGYSANGHDALVVPAVKYYSEDDNKIEYTAVITDIAAANYGRAISARSYAIVVDVYGVEHTIYGDAVTSRSVLQVAQNGLLDPNASEEEKAIFQAIVDAAKA